MWLYSMLSKPRPMSMPKPKPSMSSLVCFSSVRILSISLVSSSKCCYKGWELPLWWWWWWSTFKVSMCSAFLSKLACSKNCCTWLYWSLKARKSSLSCLARSSAEDCCIKLSTIRNGEAVPKVLLLTEGAVVGAGAGRVEEEEEEGSGEGVGEAGADSTRFVFLPLDCPMEGESRMGARAGEFNDVRGVILGNLANFNMWSCRYWLAAAWIDPCKRRSVRLLGVKDPIFLLSWSKCVKLSTRVFLIWAACR